MAERENKKDFWDKIAALTPLLLGIAVTGIGGLFTQIYNVRQLQLNQIAALDKFRPLLTSEKPEEREFAYAAFAALGYERIAIRIIQLKQDQSGRSVLVELSKSGQEDVKATAARAIQALNQAHPFTKQMEFGAGETTQNAIDVLVQEEPGFAVDLKAADAWTQTAASELKIQSKLGREILYDTTVFEGEELARGYQDLTCKLVSPPLDSREKEKAWLSEFLNQRQKRLEELVRASPGMQKFYPARKKRIDGLRKLLEEGDWDLKSLASPAKPQ